jgi:mycothiol S-conjugate amidase
MKEFRLMTVHAHPDDESSKGAATIARAAAEGVDVLVATCTGGERGDVLNPALNRPDIRENLTRIRREEMAAARDILGVRQHFLGFVDSGLPKKGDPLPADCFARQPTAEAARPLVALIREFQPQVIVTYDETGGYPHPDHIKTHEVTVAAFDAAGDPERYPDTGPPWQPSKLYYQCALRREWFQALHDAMTERGIPSPMGAILEELVDEPPLAITTRIQCADYFEVRDKALLAHATQMSHDHPFFAHPRALEREVWPTEDYHLARSLLPTTESQTEDDLFAGLRHTQTQSPT